MISSLSSSSSSSSLPPSLSHWAHDLASSPWIKALASSDHTLAVRADNALRALARYYDARSEGALDDALVLVRCFVGEASRVVDGLASAGAQARARRDMLVVSCHAAYAVTISRVVREVDALARVARSESTRDDVLFVGPGVELDAHDERVVERQRETLDDLVSGIIYNAGALDRLARY
jgi:hypothetical protein